MDDFDVEAVSNQLKQQTTAIRKRNYTQRKSRLDKYTYELLALHDAGNSAAELQRYLKSKRVNVALTTITRWLKRHG